MTFASPGMIDEFQARQHFDGLSKLDIIGLVLLNFNGDIIAVNDYALDQLGLTRAEFVAGGLNAFALIPEPYRKTARDRLEQYRRDRQGEPYEIPFMHKNGSWTWGLCRYSSLPDNPNLLLGWVINVTPWRKMSTANQFLLEADRIMASSLELQTLLEGLASAALADDFSDCCMIDLVGPSGELERRTIDCQDPDDLKLLRELSLKYPPRIDDPAAGWVVRNGQPLIIDHVDLDLLKKLAFSESDSQMLLQGRAMCFVAAPLIIDGDTIGAMVLGSKSRRYDKDDLQLAETLALRASKYIENAQLHQALRESHQNLEHFAAIAAHDLRSPLASLVGYLEILRPPESDTMGRRFYMKADRLAHQMLTHIDGLLRLSQSSRFPLTKSSVMLEQAVLSARENLKNEIDSANAQFHYSNLPTVSGDMSTLVLLFQNLFANSIRYRRQEPLRVTISARREKEAWEVTVADNGRGITTISSENLFQLFKGSTHPHSRGIGLATCRKIVEAHGGHIWAQSTPGVGTKIIFTLPVANLKLSEN